MRKNYYLSIPLVETKIIVKFPDNNFTMQNVTKKKQQPTSLQYISRHYENTQADTLMHNTTSLNTLKGHGRTEKKKKGYSVGES